MFKLLHRKKAFPLLFSLPVSLCLSLPLSPNKNILLKSKKKFNFKKKCIKQLFVPSLFFLYFIFLKLFFCEFFLIFKIYELLFYMLATKIKMLIFFFFLFFFLIFSIQIYHFASFIS